MDNIEAGVMMRKEIWEQPSALYRVISDSTPVLREVTAHSRHCRLAYLAARGSSDNASTYGKYLLEGQARLPTALAAPSLFTLYQTPPRIQDALVIGVSQSGQAADVVEVLAEARRQGAVTLAITNTAGSPLTTVAEHVITLNVGVELALAATKTVTAQCVVYALLAGMLADDKELQNQLFNLPAALTHLLDKSDRIAALAGNWLHASRVAVLGRGYTYGAAQEIALKLKETCYIGAEAYSSADFMHGPLAIIEENYPVLMLLNHDVTLEGNLDLLRQVLARGGKVTAFVTESMVYRINQDINTMVVDSPDSRLTVIPAIVAGQIFALSLSVAKGFNPDVSRGLSKVTITL